MKKNTIALSLIFCLFFLWAISSNLLPTMIRQLMKTCELNTFEASFTESAYWLAYFICPIPIAMFMKRYSYRSGIIVGLLLAATGGLLFLPAAMVKSYAVYTTDGRLIAKGGRLSGGVNSLQLPDQHSGLYILNAVYSDGTEHSFKVLKK